MTREPIEVTRQDRIYCLKVSSDYHSEVCEECRFYPNCDHMTQDDMTELTIKDLETLEQEPTTKNDLPHCQHTDEEIAKSFIEDVEAVKEHLPCGEQMDFPKSFDDFVKDYGFKDKEEVYTNGSELIPVFRVKQWLEHISATKNDLGVDCISREAVERIINKWLSHSDYELKDHIYSMTEKIHNLPSITPQPCEDAVSRKAVLDLIADYDLSMGQVVRGIHALPSVTPQLSSELEKNSKKLEKDFGELDCISRAYLLDDSKYHTVFNDDTGNFEDVVYREDIEKAPSVTPQEPRKGHWIKTSLTQVSGGDFKRGFKCSHCNYVIVTNDFNFCPNCGADMREVKE